MATDALKALIDSEPDNATRTDEEVLDWLNSDSDEYHSQSTTLQALSGKFGASNTANFLNKIETNLSNKTVKLFHTILVNEGIDVGSVAIREMLNSGASAGIIATAERDAIKNLAVLKTIAEKAGLHNVKIGHIQEARR